MSGWLCLDVGRVQYMSSESSMPDCHCMLLRICQLFIAVCCLSYDVSRKAVNDVKMLMLTSFTSLASLRGR